MAFIENLASHCAISPDLTLLLDAPVELALSRVQSRGAQTDRFESERAEFFVRVRAQYLQLAQRYPERFVVVDATGTESEVATLVARHIKALA
jgi:dTMP kinase